MTVVMTMLKAKGKPPTLGGPVKLPCDVLKKLLE